MAKKVMIGMSGGVDSSVAAAILLEQGYEVIGATLKLRHNNLYKDIQGGCCSIDDVDDAKRVAFKLGIPHYTFNFTDIFTKEVIDRFVSEYTSGRTPNPCIFCNQYIKFSAMLAKALTLDINYISTGHYAKIEQRLSDGPWLLKKSPAAKDQSYVLYNLTQFQLEHTLFPLYNLSKDEIREKAAKLNLPVANKPDSQEICFISDNNYAEFIEQYSGKKSPPGDFIDINGNILGKHQGITKYTVGQRKGLGIAFGKPMFVVKLLPETNQVVLGESGSEYSSELVADNINIIAYDKITEPIKCTAKVRYLAKPAQCIVTPIDNNKIKVQFDNLQRAVTPGQAVVLYDNDIVIGGGRIISAD